MQEHTFTPKPPLIAAACMARASHSAQRNPFDATLESAPDALRRREGGTCTRERSFFLSAARAHRQHHIRINESDRVRIDGKNVLGADVLETPASREDGARLRRSRDTNKARRRDGAGRFASSASICAPAMSMKLIPMASIRTCFASTSRSTSCTYGAAPKRPHLEF